LRLYTSTGITFFHFSFCLSVSILSAISVSQSPSPSLYPSPSPSSSPTPSLSPSPSPLLAISISLHYTEKQNIFKTGANNLLRFAYSWGHRLKFWFTWRKRKCIEIKDDSKIKRQKNIDRQVRGLYRMYATFPAPLGSHYSIPLENCISNFTFVRVEESANMNHKQKKQILNKIFKKFNSP
jgi:hypothetical protein